MTPPLKIRSSIPLRITLAVLGLVALGVWGLVFYASHLLQQNFHAALGEYPDALVLVQQRIVQAAAVVTLGVSALVWWVVRRQLSPLLSTLGQRDAALKSSEQQLKKIADRVPGLIYQFRLRADGSSCFPYASEAIRGIYGINPEDVEHDASAAFAAVHPDDLERGLASIAQSARDQTPWQQEFRVRGKDNTVRWISGNAVPEREADGATLWHGFISDITDSRQALEQQRIAATAFESLEGKTITNAQQVILKVNAAFTRITGYSAEEVVGQTPRVLSSGRQSPAFYEAMWRTLALDGFWQGEMWNRRKSGEVYPEWLVICAVKDEAGVATHYVATFSDISAHKTSEARIQNLSYYDPLTGLPNRALMMDRTAQAQTAITRNQSEGALLLIDLDHFKTLNETLGHETGDLLLQQVAQRLNTCVREGDTVARLGADEFMVLLEDLGKNTPEAATRARLVGEKIRKLFTEPYVLGEYSCHITPSIGLSLFSDGQPGIDELLKRTDLAMSQAKDSGGNTVRFFDPQMQAAVLARAHLENGLREGLAQKQFLLHYQAQVTDTGWINGAEVLVRWMAPGRGLVSPAEFIPLAEETGLILPLGQWVLETACHQLNLWATQPGLAHLTLAVNVSARQFHEPDFVAQVLATIALTGANPHRLKLELTESLLVSDVEGIIAKMNLLKAQGIGFSLDDFGTGYSSLSYLKRLPLDQLKIDQGFVRDMLQNPNDAAIAGMVVALGTSLKLAVIAEGVESQAQRDFLASQGCHTYQGYLFGRPVAVGEFEAQAVASATPRAPSLA
jgi:diguanylate cyclase (GGDEF)-like protein/PAS domain S-box-containing protein